MTCEKIYDPPCRSIDCGLGQITTRANANFPTMAYGYEMQEPCYRSWPAARFCNGGITYGSYCHMGQFASATKNLKWMNHFNCILINLFFVFFPDPALGTPHR